MMDFYIGYKLSKPVDQNEYKYVADWCNSKNAWIEDKGDYYEVCTWSSSEQEKQKLQSELFKLEDYLDSSDYMVVKCMERGLNMQSEYPLDYQKRQDARDRINEIRKEIESL